MAAYMKIRKTRLPEIIDILTHQTIRSQEELSRQLAIRGHVITQATLSRDLKLLKATKMPDANGKMQYVAGQASVKATPRPRTSYARHPAHSAVVSMAVSNNIIVFKTRNGYASGLAYEIDMLDSPKILGTIPGADTVMIVMAEDADRQEMFDLLSPIVPAAIVDSARALYANGCNKSQAS